MANQFYQLQVSALAHPIKEATTISFKVPAHLQKDFTFFPGQHLILKLRINDQEVRRSYSINSCAHLNEALQITLKRVKNGLVSNYLGDPLTIGDYLEVMPPQGHFYADIHEEAYKTYFLCAAGSGITPIFSILKSVLSAVPKSVVNLFYGNSNQHTIIFEKALAELQQKYPQRLKVVHTLSDPNRWTTWEQWKGKTGRIDAPAVEWFITNHPPIAQKTEYYICGPGAMNRSVRSTLMELGVPKELIHIEQFGGQIAEQNDQIEAVDQAQLSAEINGQTYTTTIPAGLTILKALKTVDANPPYSCESGVCGTCTAKVTKGKAEMKACMALGDKDIENGLTLTCQALPITKEIEIKF
ncbi:MAG: ferredoxin--NADP reductase [Bacteroidota bacterium]